MSLRMRPDGARLVAGLQEPGLDARLAVLERIADHPGLWSRLLPLPLVGRRRRRVPPGFDPEHRHAQDLRRTEFLAQWSWDAAEVEAPAFERQVRSRIREAGPLVRFLDRALRS